MNASVSPVAPRSSQVPAREVTGEPSADGFASLECWMHARLGRRERR
jgi:hypothetical protein